MSDLFQKITDAQSGLEKLVNAIPGFKGYMEKEKRREADKLLRDTIATRYTEQLDRLSVLQTQLITDGNLEYVDDLQDVVTRLQRFVDTVKTAARGYAGFFSAIKVKEKELAKLYAFDNALLENAPRVAQAVDAVEAAIHNKEGIPAAIRKLSVLVAECNTTFERRSEVLTAD
ncbi:MAG: hypothetical protein RMK99_06550 [Anaerolineales bacterium]|nr:hypothetical protein [Anaerolineales bacterium]